jgi:glycosyltransferase involved in cell wall biosynthesis/GT2 family glycosyltransferase
MHEAPSTGRICIVANELNHLFRNGGIGTHNSLLAESLAAAGWDVHILYCADVEEPEKLTRCRQILNEQRINFWHLSEFTSPTEDGVECGLVGYIDKHSMRVRRGLEQLNDVHHFELIEFAEWSGYGFRTVQAHKMAGALPDARIIGRLHSSNQWCREGNRSWLCGSDDLIRDYFERYSFEHADVQLSPSRYMFEYAASIGWDVRDDAQVIKYCFPASATRLRAVGSGTPELVFFGRLESRKGLKLFLQVAQSLPTDVQIAFLGRETPVEGTPAGELIRNMLGERPYTLHTDFDREQAMEYLQSGNRVAVMPSLIENYPFTVLECATNGTPFIASNVGGIPEIVASADLQQALLFDPTPRALRQKIETYFLTDQATRDQYVKQLHEICDSTINRAAVCQAYAELLPRRSSSPSAAPSRIERSRSAAAACPLVSIVVPYYNLGELVPDTLASIAAQDYPRTEVIVVNDGSTDANALQVWEEMQVQYPHFRFVTQDNQGLGAARNTGLSLAQGEYFLPMDADNIGRPDMVSRFVEALEANPDVSVATCFFLAFEETVDIVEGKFSYAYRPCGGPYVAAALRNVYGDANAMSRTAALRSVGGYETEKHTTCEDWEMYVKLVRQGHRIDVLPEHLFYYRHRASSLLRTTDSFQNRRRVLRQFFPVSQLPHAEQIQLWTALASFDEAQRQLQWSLWRSTVELKAKRRRGMRLAVHNVKQVLRKSQYYRTVSGALKQLTKRAA